jgi:predicted O-methyltransferase YrrM
MEIGVFNGENAKTMIQAALQHVAPIDVEYYGFDFFHRSRFMDVQSKLAKTGCTVHLFQGNSTTTLPKVLHTLPKMDVIFIDGGKSRAEASSDWSSAQTLMHDRTTVFVHNYEFSGVRWMVDHISREAFQVTILYPPEDVATARITKLRN